MKGKIRNWTKFLLWWSKSVTNLKEARRKGKIDEFIREREKDAPGDMDKLDAAPALRVSVKLLL